MAATDYTSQGFGTYVWTDPEGAGNKWDASSPGYGGPEHGYVQHSPWAYDPSSGRWLWVKAAENAADDYITYVYYSNVTTDLGAITGWTQCTTNIPNATTADPAIQQGITYDEDNDRFHMLYVIFDSSVSEYEARSALFTFNGSDITLIYDEAQAAADTNRVENGLYRTMDTVNETDTTPTPAADDGRAFRIINNPAGSQGLYTSYIDRSVPDETYTIGSGPSGAEGTYPFILSEHAGDIRRWFDYADMYNTTQNNMMLHQVKANVPTAYQMRWEAGTQHELYTTSGTGTASVNATNMTNSTTVPYATAWYDNTTAKFYAFGIGNVQNTGGVESAMKTSTDYGATWSADLANGQDAGDLIEAWNPTDTTPVTYILFTHGWDGSAYLCIRDSHTDAATANHAIIVLKYNCTTDAWSEFARLKPPSGQGANSEKVIGAWVDDTKSFIIVGVWHAGDAETYFYVKQFNAAPTATFTAPEDGEALESRNQLTLTWTYSDPESDAQSAWRIRRVVDATTTRYWDGTAEDWVTTETAATKVSGTATSLSLGSNWGDAGTETSHAYSIQVWDANDNSDGYTDTVTIYPSSSVSTVKGYSLPRPIKRQQDINATLRSNQDYSVSWINNYLPAYGDLNDDLYLRAGIRPAGASYIRNSYPPVVGSFSIGNSSNYYQDVAATNIYRTNEIALSSEKAKRFMQKKLGDALGFVLEVPVEQFEYRRPDQMGDIDYKLGIVAEDVEYWLKTSGVERGLDPRGFVSNHKGPDGEVLPYLHVDQLVPVLWQAVQELYAYVEQLIPPGQRKELKPVRDRRKLRTDNDN